MELKYSLQYDNSLQDKILILQNFISRLKKKSEDYSDMVINVILPQYCLITKI